MLWPLLGKDFRRTLRNPWPWLMNLGLPIAITALIGLAFGGGGKKDSQIARIKVAIVDEDGGMIGSIFKSALNQGDATKYFETVHSSRGEALQLIRDDKISAALIVPKKFTADYLAGKAGLQLEVIKNPAQQLYPAIVEELAAVAVTGLSTISRNLQSEFPEIQAAINKEFDFLELSAIFNRLGNRVKAAREYLSPPLITYKKAEIEDTKSESGPGMSVFAFILPAMAGAFLLYIADHSMRDIHKETRLKTLDRLRSNTTGTGMFVLSKVLFAALSVLLASATLFGIGGIIFRVDWQRPGLMTLVCLGYSIFAAGFMAMLVALGRTEKRSQTLNNAVLFIVAFAGGSYIPAEQFPAFLRENICPLMPNYWFIEAMRGLQSSAPGWIDSLGAIVKLAIAGLVLGALASTILHRRLTKGGRA